jgi:hypothetical protein
MQSVLTLVLCPLGKLGPRRLKLSWLRMSEGARCSIKPQSQRGAMNGNTSSNSGSELTAQVGSGVILVGVVILAIRQWAENVERNYRRSQLLAAYRCRHSWKKSDIGRLRSLGVSKVAERRIAKLEGTGRPVVPTPLSLEQFIETKLTTFNALLDPTISPQVRRRAFRSWPWWKHHVEALYRGEHAVGKARGIKSPAMEAEITVGAALGISSASVHSICGEIRAMRKADFESANFKPMTLKDYDEWMETGIRLDIDL